MEGLSLPVQLHRGAMPRRPGQAPVRGDQRRVESFGQRYVSGIVSRKVLPQPPDAAGEWGMRVKSKAQVRKVLQNLVAPRTRQTATQRVATQNVKHLNVEQMRRVQALAGTPEPPTDRGGCRYRPENPGHCRRGVKDDQKPSAEVARIVRVP